LRGQERSMREREDGARHGARTKSGMSHLGEAGRPIYTLQCPLSERAEVQPPLKAELLLDVIRERQRRGRQQRPGRSSALSSPHRRTVSGLLFL
jgi:hypothetical protein